MDSTTRNSIYTSVIDSGTNKPRHILAVNTDGSLPPEVDCGVRGCLPHITRQLDGSVRLNYVLRADWAELLEVVYPHTTMPEVQDIADLYGYNVNSIYSHMNYLGYHLAP